MTQLTVYEESIIQRIGEGVQNGSISNTAIVQIIELTGMFLNIKTISDYAKSKGISYQAARKHKQVNIFNVKFIIENE